ncbi:MAG: hypothetical protein ACOWWR_18160 [Eubacteriales bacterium]
MNLLKNDFRKDTIIILRYFMLTALLFFLCDRKVQLSYHIKNRKGYRGSIPYRIKEGAQAVKPSKGTIGFPSESVEDAIFIVL